LLLGMAITFAAVATLVAIGSGWAVHADAYGRDAAIVLLALFGLTLLFPHLSDALTRPLVALGSRLLESAADETRKGSSVRRRSFSASPPACCGRRAPDPLGAHRRGARRRQRQDLAAAAGLCGRCGDVAGCHGETPRPFRIANERRTAEANYDRHLAEQAAVPA